MWNMRQQINPKAIKLLHQACFLKKDNFICFGIYYTILKKYDLIDGDLRVTFLGRRFIKYCMDEGFFDE
jgi:hypothetical protein